MSGKIGIAIWCVVVSLLIIFVLPLSSAAPTTGTATPVGSNNATVAMSAATGTCWFQWGTQNAENMTWRTPNQTSSSGLCNATIKGSPLSGNQLFYFRACDDTGCGSDGTFTTAAVTPIPTPTYGYVFNNLSSNNFDIPLIGWATMQPYMWLVPGFEALIWGLIFMFVFIGLWLRGREIGTVTILGFIIGVILFTPAYGLDVGIPQEFAALGQGIAYACVAGFILSLIKK